MEDHEMLKMWSKSNDDNSVLIGYWLYTHTHTHVYMYY